MASRFKDLDVSVENFISEQENESTKKKTLQNVAVLQQFLASKNEERKFEEIPPEELNEYLREFIITVRTKDKQEEYEPSSLRGFIASFERYLKKKNYGHSIIKDLQFEKTRKALSSKQKDLKRKGKGSKPNASVAISEDDIQVLYEKKLLGTERPEALLNTLWLNNTTQFGLRGCKEHRDMCWVDVKLKKTSTGVEFLEYGERQTKTRLGDDTNDVRPIAPKMFSLPNSDRCPVLTYKVFAEKRPTQMNFDEAPFYLVVNNIKTDSLDKKPWFKQSPVGVNKLNCIMKVMSEKAELNKPRLKNHSGRKTMMQTLVNEEIPPTDIIQLSGHRNLQSVNNFATVSEKQQMKMSRTLSAFTTGIVSKKDAPREESSCGSSSENNKMLVSQQRTEHTVTSSTCGQQQALQIFAGATISGGNIHVSINTLNKSPILPTSPKPKYQRYKRLLSSDSESD